MSNGELWDGKEKPTLSLTILTYVPNHHVAPLWMLTPKNPPQTTSCRQTVKDRETMKEGKISFMTWQLPLTASFDSDEDWGPPVSDRLAELLERRFGRKEKLTAHRIPANCRKSMEVPKTNQEVFSTIPPFARKADMRM